jgi:chemotaxis protein histidine kinase CheA
MRWIKENWFKASILGTVFLLSAACNKSVVKNTPAQQTQKNETAQSAAVQSTSTPFEQSLNNGTSSTSSAFNLFLKAKQNPVVNEKKNDVPKPVVDNSAGLQQTTTGQAPQAATQQPKQNLIFCNGKSYNDNCALVSKKFVCYSNAVGCYTESDIDNMFVCNNNAYLSCSLKGQKDVCSSDGVASCVNNTNAAQTTAQQLADQQAAQAAVLAQKQARLHQIQTECIDPIMQLYQQLVKLKADYNTQVQQIQTHGIESGTPAVFWQGEITSLTNTTNQKIDQLNNQIQQAQINNSVNFGSDCPTALCLDGTFSYSLHNSGTCSDHSGVNVWYQ